MHQLYRHTHTISTPFSPRPAFPVPQISTPIPPHKPIHQRLQTHKHTDTTPIQPHKHTAPQTHSPTNTQPHKHTAPQTPTPTRRRPPPTLTTHREAMPYPDVDAQPASYSGPSRPDSLQAFRPDTPSQPLFVPYLAIGQARHRAGCALSHTPDQATHSELNRPGTRQAKYRIRPNLTAD